MELKQLKYFQAVAEAGSVTRASELLHITQPSLSLCIKRLETDLGTALFDRKRGKMQLTPAGSVFLEHVDAAFAALSNGRAAAARLADRHRHELSFSSNLRIFLNAVIADYLMAHEDISAHFRVESEPLIQEHLLNFEAEFAITDMPLPNARLDWEPLLETEYFLLVNREHPLSGRTSVSITELREEKFICCESSNIAATEEICRAAGFAPKLYFQGDDPAMRTAFYRRNTGISFIPAYALCFGPDDDNIAIVPLSDCPFKNTIGIVKRRDTVLSQTAQDFYGYLCAYFRTLADAVAKSTQTHHVSAPFA